MASYPETKIVGSLAYPPMAVNYHFNTNAMASDAGKTTVSVVYCHHEQAGDCPRGTDSCHIVEEPAGDCPQGNPGRKMFRIEFSFCRAKLGTRRDCPHCRVWQGRLGLAQGRGALATSEPTGDRNTLGTVPRETPDERCSAWNSHFAAPNWDMLAWVRTRCLTFLAKKCPLALGTGGASILVSAPNGEDGKQKI